MIPVVSPNELTSHHGIMYWTDTSIIGVALFIESTYYTKLLYDLTF